jgi:anti-sigma regulatory factor (Ser/Thr protein kinase)
VRAGGRHLNFYETRDNLTENPPRRLSRVGVGWFPGRPRAACFPPTAHRAERDDRRALDTASAATTGRPNETVELVTPADLHFMRADVRQLVDAKSVVMDDARCERFLLAVEELASNALRHGGAPVRARVVAASQGLLIEVSDSHADRAPQPALRRDPTLGGLGLFLVARLTTAVGWLVDAGRKYVWAYCA